MFTNEIRVKLKAAVITKLLEFKEQENLTELHMFLMGFSSKGTQKLHASTATWEYSYQGVPGGLEFLARHKFLLEDRYDVQDPSKLGLDRGVKLDLDTEISMDYGDKTHLAQFIRELPQWGELGYKPKWGKWVKAAEVSNTWNASVLCVLYELLYGKVPSMSALILGLKQKAFLPELQFNMCMGAPGPQNKIFTPASIQRALEDFKAGKPAKPQGEKSLEDLFGDTPVEKPKTKFTIRKSKPSEE